MLLRQEDEEVAAQTAFLASDSDGLRAAYDAWGAMVFALALRALGSRADAEDVTQQVFVAAWRGRHTYDPARGPLPAWLVGITRRAIVDRRRAEGRQLRAVRLDGPDGVDAPVDDDRFDWLAERMVMTAALRRLPADQRRVLELSFYAGRTHAEIAEETGLPLGTVKSQLRRGLERLRQHLEAVR